MINVKVKIISTKKSVISDNHRLTKYLFKNVFTKEGEKIGRITQIIFDKEIIQGIIISKGLFFKKIFVDMEYVSKFTGDSVILNITPILLIVGKQVFDDEGKIVGKVKRVVRKTNDNGYDHIVIKNGLFSKEKIVHPKDVIILKKNIRLKISL